MTYSLSITGTGTSQAVSAEDHEDAVNAELTSLSGAISDEATARADADDDLAGLAAVGDVIRLTYASGDGDAAVYTVHTSQSALAVGSNATVQFDWPASNTGADPTLTIGATVYTIKARAGASFAAGEVRTGEYIGRVTPGNVIRILGSTRILDVPGLQEALNGKASAAQGAKADSAVQPGDDIDELAETSTAKIMTGAERTKLAGIATGATANATDAQLRDRSTHTGTQAISTITGLQAALDTEAAARAAAVTAEANARAAAITAEAQARDSAITAEAGARATGIEAEAVARTNAIAKEAAARAAGDATLSERMDDVEVSAANVAHLVAAVPHRDDCPADAPGYFSAVVPAGVPPVNLDPALAVASGSDGRLYRIGGAGVVSRRAPVALAADVIEVTARVRRLIDPSDPVAHEVALRVRWLTSALATISTVTLLRDQDFTASDGMREFSVRVSHLAVDDVVAPPANAAYAIFFIQTYGDDGVTGVQMLRVSEVTDLHAAEVPDLSAVIAAAQAATDAALAASLTETEYLGTMANVSGWTRPENVGVLTLRGMYAPFDGLGGQWVYDPDDTTSPVQMPYVLHDADGGRWKWVLQAQRLTARHFGAANDGVINDTAALADVPVGADVDLGGRACLVDAVPTAWRGYNGTFIVDGVRYDCPPQPMGPFDGYTATRPLVLTWWPAGMVYLPDSDELITFIVQSGRHDTVGGSWLQAIRSKDHGVTDYHSCTIFSDLDHPRVRAAAIGRMSDGRVGGIVSTGENGALVSWFVWTDSATLDPSSWQRVQLTGITESVQAYGQIMPGPTRASGDWMVSCYYPACILRTDDNGDTWSLIELLDDTGLPVDAYPAEQTIVYLPSQDKWAIMSRLEGGATPHNMHISIGADLLDMPGWQDSGLDMGSQAIHALADGGRVQILFTDRDGFPGVNPDNTARVLEVSEAQLVAAPTSLGRLPHRQINGPHRLVGYAMSIRLAQSDDHLNAPWLTLLKAGEGSSTIRGTDSHILYLSQNAMVIPARVPSRMELDRCNHGFGLMRRPASALSASAEDRAGPDRWRLLNGSGDVVTISAERTALSDAERDFMPWLTHKIALTTSAANTFAGLAVRWHGYEAVEKGAAFAMRQITVRVYGIGPIPKLAPQVLIRYGDPDAPTAESLAISPGLYMPVLPDTALGPWMIEQVFELGELPCLPLDVFTVDFSVNTGATSQQWDGLGAIMAVTVWTGANVGGDRYPQSFEPDHRYLWSAIAGAGQRILSGQAANDGTGAFDIGGLLSDQRNNLSLYVSDATDYVISADSNTGGDKAVTTMALLRQDNWLGAALLQASVAYGSLTTRQHVRLKSTDDGATILIDTGA